MISVIDTVNDTDTILMEFRNSIIDFAQSLGHISQSDSNSNSDTLNTIHLENFYSSSQTQKSPYHSSHSHTGQSQASENVDLSGVLEKYSDRLVDLIAQKLVTKNS